uniref:Glycosyltransferase family 92 protein n=1 Tax=Meloidogyne hapla TaxID=6305 RepID=A0A1I8B8Z8_MELHA
WKEAIKKRIPMYIYNNNYSRRPKFDLANDNYKMNETANLFLIPKETYGTEPKLLRLKIQLYPETIEQMLIFRYWLERLSHCFIENIKIEQGLINPEMIDLFFDGSQTFKLHAKYFHLYRIFYYPEEYQFMYDYVAIYGSKGIYYDDDSDWKMRGAKIKEEERYYRQIEEREHVFCKVVEYEFFGIDNPALHVMMYILFPIGSKKVMNVESKRIF